MVATLELLQFGVCTISRKFEDGSRIWFPATASPTILSRYNLPTGIFNIDNKEEIPLEDIEGGLYEVVEKEDIEQFSKLDKYLNGGVVNGTFIT